MNSILSIFETAVADYLLLASITAAILVTIAWGLVKLGRVKGAANRHHIWLFTLFAIVLLPGIWLYGPKLTFPVLPGQRGPTETVLQRVITDSAAPITENVEEPSIPVTVEKKAPEADTAGSFEFPSGIALLAWGWFIGFLWMLTRLVAGGVNLKKLSRTAEPVSNPVGLDGDRKYRVELLVSRMVDSPVCFGLLRPVILMPKQMYENASSKDLNMILRHELAHIERRDCWINLFQRLVEAVFFFHPFIWYASFRLTQHREELCDQHVIVGGASPESYVELLGKIARQGFEKRSLQAVALFEGRLLSRVKRLLGSGGRVQIRASRKTMRLLALAAMLCLVSGTVRLEARPGASTPTDTAGQGERPGTIYLDELDQPYSISGRVLGEDGEPASKGDLVVKALKMEEIWADGPVVYTEDGRIRVEPDGSYTLYRLSGDPVIIAVTESSRYGEEEESLPLCYYPGTVSRDQAIWVDFEGGTSRDNVDIQLAVNGGGLLEGTVTDAATGEPVPDTIVALTPSDSLAVYMSAFTDESGNYRFENIGEGEWLAHVDARSSGYVRMREPVTLETGKIARLDAALEPAASVSGYIVDENGEPFGISNMDIGKAYTEAPISGSNSMVAFDIPSDGDEHQVRRIISKFSDGQGDYPDEEMVFPTEDSFLVKAILPGKTHLELYHLENGVEVKEILYNGKSIMAVEERRYDGEKTVSIEAVLETRPGETVEGVAFVLGPVADSQ